MTTEDLIVEAQNPATRAARLQEIAQLDRGAWPAIAANPSAYPGLLQWLGEHGDDSIRSIIAGRSGATPAEVTQPFEPTQPIEPVEPVEPVEQTTQIPVTPDEPAEPTEPTAAAAATAPMAAAAPSYGSVPPDGEATSLATADDGSGGKRKNFWILAGMVAVVLVLIGGIAFGATQVFGGDDDSDDTTSSRTEDDTTDDADTPDSDPATEAPNEDDSPFGSGGSGESSEFCSAFSDLQEESAESMGGTTSTPDLAELQDSLGEMADGYADLVDSAPSEIKADVEVMAEYFDTFKDPASIDPSTMENSIAEFGEATQKVSTYYASNCL